SRPSPHRIPHGRGGVSLLHSRGAPCATSSPRTWRCFTRHSRACQRGWVFSTHVEVFLKNPRATRGERGLLHARGGVSGELRLPVVSGGSSPRTGRCFERGEGRVDGRGGFW